MAAASASGSCSRALRPHSKPTQPEVVVMCECADQSGSGPHLLHIPDEALTVAGAAFLAALERATVATPSKDPRDAYPDEVIAAAVEAAAPVIVAAELRRLSYEIALFAPGYHELRLPFRHAVAGAVLLSTAESNLRLYRQQRDAREGRRLIDLVRLWHRCFVPSRGPRWSSRRVTLAQPTSYLEE